MQQYLQHLVPDRHVGYLFPHSLAMGAFGVQKEYHLLKHRPRLVENQHWFKLKGADHIVRVYYSLSGLLKLADLINTPQAQAFKQALIQHCQAGAIVKSQSAPLYSSPTIPTEIYTEPATTTAFEPNGSPAQSLTPADPAYAVAQYLQPDISRVMEQAIASHTPMSAGVVPPGSLSPQETAALIFEAQRVASEHIFQAQRLAAEHSQSPEIHLTVNLWDQWNSWLEQQDAFAFSLVAAGLIALMGVGSWLLIASAVRPAPDSTPSYSTQSTWR
ncbi:hypothetical protein IQ268_28665 [Oculatella sp. LEGE 06141]|uniref:hypothetical protein n=1 Tax=Oculatella sp. LEGE 06141 TaxID=1828648 RepID=UPI00188004A5|nr:hypothetical protein [Oculatella sp. LEGE 06141]MBE9182527.1 hypothetical protein [Oculatella sp. LEGE 06141]